VPLQNIPYGGAGFDIPQTQANVVLACRNDGFSIRAEGDAQDVAFVSFQRLAQRLAPGIPHAEATASATGNDARLIRADGQRRYGFVAIHDPDQTGRAEEFSLQGTQGV